MSANIGSKKTLVSVGKYRVLRVLGKGNFARVEEAVHTVLKIKVAIKIIDTGELHKDYVIKNLTREAKLLSMLRHPSIVRLYETIQCGSAYCLVTELATGGDLYTHIKKQPMGRLDETTAKLYSRQLVAALEHMHSRGIVHRDLKMENIMLQDARKEQIKIVDFGLSNIYTSDNPLKTHCGSPEYAAPELFIVGKKYGPEVDLWSLGVILYGMTTGRLPFLSPWDGQISSEERRRRLMAQINRGLTTLQEKGIATMSNEYKNLVNRLLVPIAHKRITIQELRCHPWITNRTRTTMKVTSENDLDAMEHNTIVNEIAEVTNLNRSIVEMNVIQKKYGEIGGMYNIKAHEMRKIGSVRAFQARSWSLSQGLKHDYSNLNTSTPTRSFTRNRPRCSPARNSLSAQPTTTTNIQQRIAGHRIEAKSSSSGETCKSTTWATKERKNSPCPIHIISSTTPIQLQQGRWRRANHAHINDRTVNKSVGNFTEKPMSQPPLRQTPSSIPPTSITPGHLYHRAPQPIPGINFRDPVPMQWVNIREERELISVQGQAVPGFQAAQGDCTTRMAVPFVPRNSRSSQIGIMGQGDKILDRRFYRSGSNRTELQKSARVILPNGSKIAGRGNPSTRPVQIIDEKLSFNKSNVTRQWQNSSGSSQSAPKSSSKQQRQQRTQSYNITPLILVPELSRNCVTLKFQHLRHVVD